MFEVRGRELESAPVRERCSFRERGGAPLGRGADPPSRRSCSAGIASNAPAAVPTRTNERIGA